jgi:hypothetical protein
MDEEDNSDLILESVLNTHNQLLQSLRQRRSSLLNLTKINIIFLSIVVGFAGVSVQSNIGLKLYLFLPPVLLISTAIFYGMVSFYSFSEQWGYIIDDKFVSEVITESKESVLKELVNNHENASEFNQSELKRIQSRINRILTIMAMTSGYLTFMIFSPTL